MNKYQALRLHKQFDDLATATQWLTQQSTIVQEVTTLNGNGILSQGPVVKHGAFVDPTARLIGGMIISEGCYVGPYAVIRLDEKNQSEPLVIGKNSNIQDCAIVHSTTSEIGENVIVAHQAIVHGAKLCNNVALYIQAVADGNGTVIGEGAFLHQGSYVGKNIQIHPNTLVPAGAKILTQTQADKLGPVPDALKDIQCHVLELNDAHNKRYLGM